jgi:hypothetical protein
MENNVGLKLSEGNVFFILMNPNLKIIFKSYKEIFFYLLIYRLHILVKIQDGKHK